MSRIHVKSGIFFPNPHVLKITYTDTHSPTEFNLLRRKLYKIVTSTWGYSTLVPINYANCNSTACIAYLCFANPADMLAVCMCTKPLPTIAHLWPSGKIFTIHEYNE